MRRLRVALTLGALAVAASAVSAQQAPPTWPRPRTFQSVAPPPPRVAAPSSGAFVTEVVLGALGSAGGAVAGVYVGRAVCETTSPCAGEDPGLVEGFTGAIVGSILGTAFGTHVGARVSGGPGGHVGARIGGALLGLLAAGGVFQWVDGDADQAVALISIPVMQSLVTVLLAPRN